MPAATTTSCGRPESSFDQILESANTPHPQPRPRHAPRFSPDDEWVLFTSQRGEFNDEFPLLRVVFQPQPYGELHAIRVSDRTVVRLTHNKWEDGPTAWVRGVPLR